MNKVPVFEILKPNHAYLLVRRCNKFLVAVNKRGTIILEWIGIEK